MGVSGCEKLLDDLLNNGGGVVFIDEAYQLSSGNSPGGLAVLDFLLAEVENQRSKVCFILAGYAKQMETFFAHNPGIPSRFPLEMKFEDYTDDEMLQILTSKVNSKYGGRMNAEDGLGGLYCRIVTRRLGRGRNKEGFGNARAVENQLSIIYRRQSERLRRERHTGLRPDDLLLVKEDIIGPKPSNALLQSKAWVKLQELIGLTSVKNSIKSLVDTIETNYQRELDEEPIVEYSLNRVFLGNPGTGKTTVAKLYGQVLADIGLLSNGEVVVKNPSDFVGPFIGHSEKQTNGILAATIGKVLVIDEAYAMYGGNASAGGGSSNSFKADVVDTIVANVHSTAGEDRCILLLGYRDQMEEMLQNVNPGLSRRFPLSSAFTFEDFNQMELRSILDLKLKQQGFRVTDEAKKVALAMLDRARNRPNFGNAGEVDTLLNEAKVRHQSRLAQGETRRVSTVEALDFDENHDRLERAHTNVAQLFDDTVGCDRLIGILQGYQNTARTSTNLGLDPKEHIPFTFIFRGPPGTGKSTTARKLGKVFYDAGFLASPQLHDCSASDLVGQYVGQTGPKAQ
ncbi:Protein CbxX, plasmid [Beauveria bassiana]|nr:Protein CbxX, plasmid [Beauveria bassiana]